MHMCFVWTAPGFCTNRTWSPMFKNQVISLLLKKITFWLFFERHYFKIWPSWASFPDTELAEAVEWLPPRQGRAALEGCPSASNPSWLSNSQAEGQLPLIHLCFRHTENLNDILKIIHSTHSANIYRSTQALCQALFQARRIQQWTKQHAILAPWGWHSSEGHRQ